MSNFKPQAVVLVSLLLFFQLICYSLPRVHAAQTDDEAAVRQVIDKFFIAFKERDEEGMRSLWGSQPPASESGQKEFQQFLAEAGKLEIESYRLSSVAVASGQAEAEVVVTRAARQQIEPGSAASEMNLTLRLVKRSDGWKVWRYAQTEEDLATELARAATDAERQALLDRKRAFVTAKLVGALLKEGNALQDRGRVADALSIFRLSLTIAENLGDKSLRAVSLRQIGNINLAQGNYAQALDYYQKSLGLSEELGSKQDIAGVSLNIGHVHALRGDYAQALDYYQKVLKLAEELGHKEIIASSFNAIGNVYKAQGAYSLALDSYQKSLKLAEEIKHTLLTGLLLNNIGNIYHSQNNAVRALEYYGRSLRLAEGLGNKRSTLIALTNIGGVHSSQGNYSMALEYYGRSLKLAEETGSKDSIARLLGNSGLVYKLLGNYAQALEYHQRALKLGEELGSKELLAGSLNNIGDVYASQSRFDEALDYYQRSLKIAEQMGSAEYTAQALGNVGETYLMLNRPQQAVEASGRAAAMASEVGLPGRLWASLTTVGKAQRLLNRPDLAKQSFLNAISTIEKLRTQVAGGEQARQRFFENKVSPYYAMVDLLIQEKDLAQAFNYAERAKGRVLLDILSSGRVNITKAMTSPELEQDRALTAEMAALNSRILQLRLRGKPDADELARLNAQLEKARLAYESFQESLYISRPELKVQRGEARALTLNEVDALLIDYKTALLEYVVMEEKTYIFVITKTARSNQERGGGPSLRVYSIDIKSKELANLAEDFRQRVAERNLAIKQLAQRLYDLLIKPIEGQLQGVSRLCVVPDGPLWNLPFQALHQGKRGYLLEQYAVFYAPSLSVLKEMERRVERPPSRVGSIEPLQPQAGSSRKGAPELLALGNPSLNSDTVIKAQLLRSDEVLSPLPDAEREVRALGQLYGPARSRVLIGGQATERTVKSEAARYSLLHFAAHAVLDDRNPMYSRIVLSRGAGEGEDDGLLEAWEILKLDLHADLVVLSACQTARGRVGDGEGVIGLAWAVFVAGCPTVIVSQWKVDSARTADLMIEFHQNLLKKGKGQEDAATKAEALRLAALKVLRSKYNHPAYWAGFVLIGADR